MKNKVKLLRVVTQAEVVIWHLKNFIERSESSYDLYITGNNVEQFRNQFPNVTFINNKIRRKTSFFSDIAALSHLIITCIKIRPRIIHSIMPKAGLLAPIAGWLTFVPIRIHTFTGQVWATKSGFTRLFYKFIDKIIFKFATVCLTDSPSQSNFLFENGFAFKGKPIEYLGKGSLSGVNLNKFDAKILTEKNKFRSSLGIDENDFVYIYLARKSIVKGINELFESFNGVAHLPNVKLLFIGPDESDGVLDFLNREYKHLQNKIISLDIVEDHQNYLAIA